MSKCYKNVDRECDVNCAAFTLGVISGRDSQKRVLVFNCVDLAAKLRLVTVVEELGNIIQRKRIVHGD